MKTGNTCLERYLLKPMGASITQIRAQYFTLVFTCYKNHWGENNSALYRHIHYAFYVKRAFGGQHKFHQDPYTMQHNLCTNKKRSLMSYSQLWYHRYNFCPVTEMTAQTLLYWCWWRFMLVARRCFCTLKSHQHYHNLWYHTPKRCRSRNSTYKVYQAVIDVKKLSQNNDVELDELFSYLRSIINIFFGCFSFDEFYNWHLAPPSFFFQIFAFQNCFTIKMFYLSLRFSESSR